MSFYRSFGSLQNYLICCEILRQISMYSYKPVGQKLFLDFFLTLCTCALCVAEATSMGTHYFHFTWHFWRYSFINIWSGCTCNGIAVDYQYFGSDFSKNNTVTLGYNDVEGITYECSKIAFWCRNVNRNTNTHWNVHCIMHGMYSDTKKSDC